MKFILGLTNEQICERINYQRNIVVAEAQKSLVQFANALNLVEK